MKKINKSFEHISKKASELAEEKRIRKAGHPIRTAIRSAAVALLAVALFAVCQTKLDNKVALPVEGLSAEELIKDAGENPVRLALVYSADEWAKDECVRLSEKISAAYDISPVTVSEKEFEGKYSDWNLSVILGHTALYDTSYFDTFTRLGQNGYEISPVEEGEKTLGVNIIAFNADSARVASNRFIEYFLGGGSDDSVLTEGADSLYVEVVDRTDINAPVVFKTSSDGGVLTVASPGADSYSLKALEALIKETNPAIVVFNGGLNCGQLDRSGISEAWNGITALLSKYDLPFTCAFDCDKNTEVSNSLLYEIVSSYPSYLDVFSDREGEEKQLTPFTYITVKDENNTVKYINLIINGSVFEKDENQKEAIDALKYIDGILERSGIVNIPTQVTVAGVPLVYKDTLTASQDGIIINESLTPYVLDYADTLYGYLKEIKVNSYMFTAGALNVGTLKTENGVYMTLGGKEDFSSFGLGGRFELNNSLRGAAITKLCSDGSFDVRFIYAADIGACVK